MNNLMGPRSFFGNVFNKIQNLILLNIVFAISVIPVLTFGAGLAALYSVVSKSIDGPGMTVAVDYFQAFKKYFKRATAVWVMLLPMLILLTLDFALVSEFKVTVRYASYGILGFSALVWFSVTDIAFPLLSISEEKGFNIIKKSMACSVFSVWRTWFAVFVKILPILIFVMAPMAFTKLFFVWVLIYFPLAEHVNFKLMGKILKKFK